MSMLAASERRDEHIATAAAAAAAAGACPAVHMHTKLIITISTYAYKTHHHSL